MDRGPHFGTDPIIILALLADFHRGYLSFFTGCRHGAKFLGSRGDKKEVGGGGAACDPAFPLVLIRDPSQVRGFNPSSTARDPFMFCNTNACILFQINFS